MPHIFVHASTNAWQPYAASSRPLTNASGLHTGTATVAALYARAGQLWEADAGLRSQLRLSRYRIWTCRRFVEVKSPYSGFNQR